MQSNHRFNLTGIRIAGQTLNATSRSLQNGLLKILTSLPCHTIMRLCQLILLLWNNSLPDKIQYAYFLEGWDKDWIYPGQVKTANYKPY
jgi:hypothetical protein